MRTEGESTMRFTACACRPGHYRRGHRPAWLKLMTSRGLYHCYCCSAVLLLPRDTVPDGAGHSGFGDLRLAFEGPFVGSNEKPA